MVTSTSTKFDIPLILQASIAYSVIAIGVLDTRLTEPRGEREARGWASEIKPFTTHINDTLIDTRLTQLTARLFGEWKERCAGDVTAPTVLGAIIKASLICEALIDLLVTVIIQPITALLAWGWSYAVEPPRSLTNGAT